jgi:hypothetical protein
MDFIEEMMEALNIAGKLHRGVLDDEVHEVASLVASSINNDGEEAQIEYLSRMLGEDGTRALILSCL